MQLEPDELADAVVQAIDVALGPLLERVAGLEARVSTLGTLRDQVVTLETKAATPAAPDPRLDSRIDAVDTRLTGALEHLAAAEARLAVLGDLRDRVVTVETKAAQPRPADPAIDVLDGRVTGLLERLGAAELCLELKTAAIAPLLTSLADLTKENSVLRERVAVLETRAPVAGPAGHDGVNGLHGKDGADGLGFGDLSLIQEDDRTLIVRASRDGQTKDVGTLTLPVELYRGVYLEGKTYQRGDCVTWAGSEWHGNETTTTKPGEGSRAWTLKVKRGRDGKDGRDAPGALPVVSVGGGR